MYEFLGEFVVIMSGIFSVGWFYSSVCVIVNLNSGKKTNCENTFMIKFWFFNDFLNVLNFIVIVNLSISVNNSMLFMIVVYDLSLLFIVMMFWMFD